MSITGALVLFVVIWFMSLFVVLPINMRSQGDTGEVVPGTHAGAPANFRLGRTVLWTTIVAVPIFAAIAGVILSGIVTVDMLDWHDNLNERVPN